MAKRPDDVDPEQWKMTRARHWGRVNWFLNIAMIIVIVAVVARNCASS